MSCFSGEISKKTLIFIGIIDDKTMTYTIYGMVENIDPDPNKKLQPNRLDWRDFLSIFFIDRYIDLIHRSHILKILSYDDTTYLLLQEMNS